LRALGLGFRVEGFRVRVFRLRALGLRFRFRASMVRVLRERDSEKLKQHVQARGRSASHGRHLGEKGGVFVV
jgi:hypothetical protein